MPATKQIYFDNVGDSFTAVCVIWSMWILNTTAAKAGVGRTGEMTSSYMGLFLELANIFQVIILIYMKTKLMTSVFLSLNSLLFPTV